MAETQQGTGGLRFEDLMAVQRVSAPCVSPDGTRVAFVTSKHDPEANEVRHTIRLLDLATREVRELTPGPGNHSAPAWSPDGRRLAFVSDRERGEQLWILPVDAGEARRVTSGYGGVKTPVWAPDSRRIAFSRRVVVSRDYDPAKDQAVDDKAGPDTAKVYGLPNPKSSARVFGDLLFRHWDEWRERRRNHLFLADAESGETVDLTPFDRDVPPISLGSDREFAFRPDGGEIAFSMNPDPVVARSTNNSIFTLALSGLAPQGEPRCISDTQACDGHPRYTPDGKIAYLGMETPGFESDRRRLKLYDPETAQTAVCLEHFDRSPEAFELAGDGASVWFVAEDRGRKTLYRLDVASGRVFQLTSATTNHSPCNLPGQGRLLVVRESFTGPADLHLLTPDAGIEPVLGPGPLPSGIPSDAGASAERLTFFGEAVSTAARDPGEEFWFAGADGDPVHGFLLRPPGFSASRRYPLVLLIHGGPQGAFLDEFHYRWNPQVFAAAGAVVALLNPRGSSGYGQRFLEQISGDWGGRCYEDILRGVDFVVRTFPFVDPERMGAAGASFGGFMVNWIGGHANPFKALVSHDGVFFAETMAYTTDELWFDEHEHGGMPHVDREPYERFSPHRLAGELRTPTLVVHGGKDFRCPVSEGIGLFTALQVNGTPSRFLYFPDEGHWVLQPANAQVWYREVVGWLTEHLGGGVP